MRKRLARSIALLCVAACATAAGLAAWPAREYVLTDDRNADGRPDVWQHYDSHGQPTEIDIDSNFDGRSDIREYYDHGALVRRESDRDFNDRIDLVEDFDADTHEHIRSIVDVDNDGSADLLVLFRAGQPVFSKRASPVAVNARSLRDTSARPGNDQLASLADPFRDDAAVRHGVSVQPDSGVDLCSPDALPALWRGDVSPAIRSTRIAGCDREPRAIAGLLSPSPRGPPLS